VISDYIAKLEGALRAMLEADGHACDNEVVKFDDEINGLLPATQPKIVHRHTMYSPDVWHPDDGESRKGEKVVMI
jgi:hypothetical protein